MTSRSRSTSKGSPFAPVPKLEARMMEVLEDEKRTVTGLIIFLRGLPGSGKTELARRLKKISADARVFSVGQFFSWKPKANLSSDSDELVIATAACKQAVWSAVEAKQRFIIIDNDNLRYSDMLPYASQAVSNNNYEVHFVQPDGMSQYSLTVLAKRNRRGLDQDRLREMLIQFETFLTAEEFVAHLRSRRRFPPAKLRLKLGPPLALSNPQPSPPKEEPQEPPSVDDLTDKILDVLSSCSENVECSSEPPFFTKSEKTIEEKLEQLKAVYPNHRLSHLKEALELGNGSLEYASAIVAEHMFKESNSEPFSDSDVEVKLESMLGGDKNNEDIPMTESSEFSDDAIENVRCIRLPPQFIKYLLEKHASELPHPSVDFDDIPPHKFDDWEPDENLSKQIFLSFFEHICSDNRDKKPASECGSKDTKGGFPSRFADDLPQSSVEEDRVFQEAILESVKPFEEKFQDPDVLKNLRELESAYPSIDRKLIKAAMVRSGFNIYEVKLCLEGNLLDAQSFQEASDFALALSSRKTEESKSEQKHKSKRSYAATAGRSTLAKEFPSFGSSALEELLDKYGSVEGVRNFLRSLGHVPQSRSICSDRELSNVMNGKRMLFPYTPDQAMQILDSEEKRLQELCSLKQKLIASVKTTLPEAKSFYMEEVHWRVGQLRMSAHLPPNGLSSLNSVGADFRRQTALVGGLQVSVNSQKKFDELLKEGKLSGDLACRTRTWFGHLDLHKMTSASAETALKQRITICRKGKVLPYTPLPTFGIVPSVVAPDGSFRLPSQYRPRKLIIITGRGSLTIRKNVEVYLNRIGLCHTLLNPGCLEVDFNYKLPR